MPHWEAPVDGGGETHQRETRILAYRHAGRAGMVLLALEVDAVLPDAYNAGDDAEPEIRAVEKIALLDMGLQEAPAMAWGSKITATQLASIAIGRDLLPRRPGESRVLQCAPQRRAVGPVRQPVDLRVVKETAQRAAADERAISGPPRRQSSRQSTASPAQSESSRIERVTSIP
jgi:hypothetical protein